MNPGDRVRLGRQHTYAGGVLPGRVGLTGVCVGVRNRPEHDPEKGGQVYLVRTSPCVVLTVDPSIGDEYTVLRDTELTRD